MLVTLYQYSKTYAETTPLIATPTANNYNFGRASRVKSFPRAPPALSVALHLPTKNRLCKISRLVLRRLVIN